MKSSLKTGCRSGIKDLRQLRSPFVKFINPANIGELLNNKKPNRMPNRITTVNRSVARDGASSN